MGGTNFLLWITLDWSGLRWIALAYSGRPPVGAVENAIEEGFWGSHFLSECKREKFHYPSRFGYVRFDGKWRPSLFCHCLRIGERSLISRHGQPRTRGTQGVPHFDP